MYSKRCQCLWDAVSIIPKLGFAVQKRGKTHFDRQDLTCREVSGVPIVQLCNLLISSVQLIGEGSRLRKDGCLRAIVCQDEEVPFLNPQLSLLVGMCRCSKLLL